MSASCHDARIDVVLWGVGVVLSRPTTLKVQELPSYQSYSNSVLDPHHIETDQTYNDKKNLLRDKHKKAESMIKYP